MPLDPILNHGPQRAREVEIEWSEIIFLRDEAALLRQRIGQIDCRRRPADSSRGQVALAKTGTTEAFATVVSNGHSLNEDVASWIDCGDLRGRDLHGV